MSSKMKRKVTVENSKDNTDHPRRPSVFERLGPGAVNISSQSQDRHSKNERCRNWLRTGNCSYGSACRYQHDPLPSSLRRTAKAEKDIDEKDLRHKVRSKKDEPKESRTGSISPKRKESKRSGSRSRKGEHESKIKSTVVVTRPRSPAAASAEAAEKEKKKPDGSWEADSDDWPMDAEQLDYKEELTLERKRQQLQRELELELQKERMLNESVTITKTVSFSESSSTSSSSDSGTVSSSSDSSSSSSSDNDSEDSSSSSSSSSSSASQAPVKKRYKKTVQKKESVPEKIDTSAHSKPRDDYDKIKSSRAAKANAARMHSPVSPDVSSARRGRDRRNLSPPPLSPKRRVTHEKSSNKSSSNVKGRGPRTPSPVPVSAKQRQWEQSSSADSKSLDLRHGRGKRHKKKRDAPRNDRYKSDHAPAPPILSSPNRTALLPHNKKGRQRNDDKSRHRNRDQSPLLLPKMSGRSNSPSVRLLSSGPHYSADQDKFTDKSSQLSDRSRSFGRKNTDDVNSRLKRVESRDRMVKRPRLSPSKDNRHESISPHRDKYDGDNMFSTSRKMYSSPHNHADKDDKGNRRRRTPPSPARSLKDNRDRRKGINESDKRREISPRNREGHRDNQYHDSEPHGYSKKDSEPCIKRMLSPDVKKGRDDRSRDRGPKERNIERESSWNDDHKPISRVPEPRGRKEPPPTVPLSVKNDRSRDRDRKKGKERDREPPLRSVDETSRDRSRLASPVRASDILHPREPEPALPIPRGHAYEPDIPPDDREYPYEYDIRRDPLYMDDRLGLPEYDHDILRGPLYPSSSYSDPRYPRDPPLKDPGPPPRIERIGGYAGRDVVSPRDIHPAREIGIPGRNDDYLADIPLEERHAFDERWGRNRPVHDDWDPYPPVPAAPLPVHVANALDEDRYGMPRRRRASPEWQPRNDDRDLSLREPRSRSPPHRRPNESIPPNRNSWGDHPDRHRSSDNRPDNQQKIQDDRKGRNGRRDRRDRNKRPDEPLDIKPPVNKDKLSNKRPHSPSPGRKDNKKRKEDAVPADLPTSSDRVPPAKKIRDEPKSEPKGSGNRNHKTVKNEQLSPKVDSGPRSTFPSKSEGSLKSVSLDTKAGKQEKEKEEKKSRRHNDDKIHVDDDFSDWSDGDDDLLNRDDFNDYESNAANEKNKAKSDDNRERRERNAPVAVAEESNKSSKEFVRDVKQKIKEAEPRSRTGSKERVAVETSVSNKESIPTLDLKENESLETFIVKDEAATDVDEYITTESVDYDPISDDELEALIEEPDEPLSKSSEGDGKAKIVDALDVNWSTLMDEPKAKTEFVPGCARQRFKAVHVLSRIGFSQNLAGSKLSKKIIKYCQEQLDQEKGNTESASKEKESKDKKFTMEHPVAAFHVVISQHKKERQELFDQVGPSRRALCARRDLQIRKLLCQEPKKLQPPKPISYSQPCANVDKDLYKQSVELLKLRKNMYQPLVIDTPC